MNNDLISRSELKKAIENYLEKRQDVIIWETDMLNMLDNAPTIEYPFYAEAYQTGYEEGQNERSQGEIVIKCKDCKYQVKEWREDKRMKDKGFWVYGCNHFGEIMGYWGFGGNDNEFCSDAEQKGGAK